MSAQNQQQLLEEIFLAPSQQIIPDRFSSEQQAADCTGRCSGICGTVSC